MTATKIVIDSKALNHVEDIARQLIMDDVRGNQHPPIDRNLIMLEALELYLISKGLKPQFTVKNGVNDI